MLAQSLFAFAAAVATAEAAAKGFNYGATWPDGTTPRTESDFEALFNRANSLPGTEGFTSARLYTMIQSNDGSDPYFSEPIEAIQAAINTQTQLLLGVWVSGNNFSNEIAALQNAINMGPKFTSLVTALSVGNEDLYRNSATGISKGADGGSDPDHIIDCIQQLKAAIQGTALAHMSIGHVDTWDAWVNGSNAAVIENVDWLGVDSYPYYESTVDNTIGAPAKTAFFESYHNVTNISGGKPVWITETGWPVVGPPSGGAIASPENAGQYWQDVGCEILGNINTWWFTIQDTPGLDSNVSFGLIGPDLSSEPMYSLACNASSKAPISSSVGPVTSSRTSSSTATSTSGSTATPTDPAGGPNRPNSQNSTSFLASSSSVPGGSSSTSAVPSGPATASTTPTSVPQNAASHAGSAMGAAILAIFGLVATL